MFCVMLWAVLRWSVGLFISPCELILGVIAMNEYMLLCVNFVNIYMLDILT